MSSSMTSLFSLCKLKIHQRFFLFPKQVYSQTFRWIHISTPRPSAMTDGEKKIADILTNELEPKFLKVRDISGGCGSMYEICIDSDLFKGKRILQQHQMVNKALGEEVKSLHGLTIKIGSWCL
ncbi:uncharacterized protein LOC135342081 isoform X2 [Halichondria panicea]|uniref:uncharacterized protein LOC135342081 isoform X2 n=1 Tax=Halichondria panicea TaxID=6063 RepID=UPI00312B7F91